MSHSKPAVRSELADDGTTYVLISARVNDENTLTVYIPIYDELRGEPENITKMVLTRLFDQANYQCRQRFGEGQLVVDSALHWRWIAPTRTQAVEAGAMSVNEIQEKESRL